MIEINAALLLRSLAAFLRAELVGYAAAQGGDKEFETPTVYEWSPPLKSGKVSDDTSFPYVALYISDTKDEDEGSVATVHLLYGVRSDGAQKNGHVHPDGVYDLLNLMSHVRTALFRQRLIDQKFTILKPYEQHIPREQPYPYWVGQATSLWEIGAPIAQLVEEDIHGLRI